MCCISETFKKGIGEKPYSKFLEKMLQRIESMDNANKFMAKKPLIFKKK